jgi:hypothetical protein
LVVSVFPRLGGAGGGGGGGAKSTATFTSGKQLLSKGWWVSQFQTAMGSKKGSVGKCVQCFLARCVDQARRGYLGPVFSCVPCGKRESGNPTLRDCKFLHKVKEKTKH